MISLQSDVNRNNSSSGNMTSISPNMMHTFLENTLLGNMKEEARRTLKLSVKKAMSGSDVSRTDSGDEDIEESVWSTVLETWFIKQDEAWQHVKPCQDVNRKKFEILRQLKSENPQMMDLKISLYITAANNDVRLKPYPEHIVDPTPEGMQALTWVNSLIPPLGVLTQSLSRGCGDHVDDSVVNVIHWLVVQLRQPKLVNLPAENFDSVFERVEFALNLQTPTSIVKIMVNNLSSNHLQWQAAKGKQATKYAFYATKVENIHSIVHLGLYPRHKTVGSMGHGIYLTSDLQTCLNNSPPSWAWGKSAFGTQLQTVAVVEFIASHPRVVRYRDGNLYPSGKPYHYFVPHNNLVQARYILIFVKDTHHIETGTLKTLMRQKFQAELLQFGLIIGGYIALCIVAWKYIKSSNSSNIWFILNEKMKGNNFLAPFALFIQLAK